MPNDSLSIRLREARRMRRLSMDKLIELADFVVTKQSLSRYERGIMRPHANVISALAKALDISEDYFLGTNILIDMPMLRTTSGGKLQEDGLTAIEARLAYWTERLLAKERAVGISGEFRNPIEDFQVSSLEDAIQATDLLRRLWHCGDGPIASVLRLLERKGIRIMEDELPAGVYGLSTWADHRLPLIVLDLREDKTTVDRLRFTAAHELAHLLLSFPPSPDLSVEKRCNKFASFFLFPKSAFIEEMGGEHRDELTLGEMTDLKELYGVSIAAQVHEAWDLRMISREHYDWWYDENIKKNKMEEGWGEYAFPETVGREKRMDARIRIKIQGNK